MSPGSSRLSPTNHLLLSQGQIFKETLGVPRGSKEWQRAELPARSEDTAVSVRCGSISPAASGSRSSPGHRGAELLLLVAPNRALLDEKLVRQNKRDVPGRGARTLLNLHFRERKSH